MMSPSEPMREITQEMIEAAADEYELIVLEPYLSRENALWHAERILRAALERRRQPSATPR